MFKEILEQIAKDLFSRYSSFGDRITGVIATLMLLAIMMLVGTLVFRLVDEVGVGPTETAITAVDSKQIRPAYSSTILVGKVIVPRHHPQAYFISFKISGTEVSASVTEEFFSTINVGDHIMVDYGSTRLSHSHESVNIKKQ